MIKIHLLNAFMLIQPERQEVGKFYKYITQHKGTPQVIILFPNLWLPNSEKFWICNIDYSGYQTFPNWQFTIYSCSEKNPSPKEMLTFFCLIKIFCNILCEYIVQLAIISEDIQGGDKRLGHQMHIVILKPVYTAPTCIFRQY